MKSKNFADIERRLPRELTEGFAAKGRLLFVSPFQRTLRGFLFESSAFDAKDFYVNVFFLPLCVPVKQVHITFGHRLGATKRWSNDDPGLVASLTRDMQAEVPFLKGLDTPERVAQALEPLTKRSNPHCYEALAYTLVQAGNSEAAMTALDTLLNICDLSVPWQQEIAERAQLIRGKLASGIEAPREQLAAWESETAAQLGVSKNRLLT